MLNYYFGDSNLSEEKPSHYKGCNVTYDRNSFNFSVPKGLNKKDCEVLISAYINKAKEYLKREFEMEEECKYEINIARACVFGYLYISSQPIHNLLCGLDLFGMTIQDFDPREWDNIGDYSNDPDWKTKSWADDDCYPLIQGYSHIPKLYVKTKEHPNGTHFRLEPTFIYTDQERRNAISGFVNPAVKAETIKRSFQLYSSSIQDKYPIVTFTGKKREKDEMVECRVTFESSTGRDAEFAIKMVKVKTFDITVRNKKLTTVSMFNLYPPLEKWVDNKK